MMKDRWPLFSKLSAPFGLEPKVSPLVPSGLVVVIEARLQVPASCSLTVFCWATAFPASKASPNAVAAEIVRRLRRFIVFFLWIVRRTEDARHNQRANVTKTDAGGTRE